MDGGIGVDSFHERQDPGARIARKQRDIFPLPMLDEVCVGRPTASRKVVRKHLAKEHVRKEVNHTIWALNSMYGAAQHSGPCYISLEEEIFGVGASQLRALDYVKQSVHAVGRPPEGLTCSGAFESLELRGDTWTSQPWDPFAPSTSERSHCQKLDGNLSLWLTCGAGTGGNLWRTL